MTGYIASLVCAIITFGMALLQLTLTFGAPFGEYALGGSSKVLSKKMRIVSCTFSLVFILVGILYLQLNNILDIGLNPGFVKIVIIINTIFLAYAIVGNGILTRSKKEKYVMTPISAVQFIFSVIALLNA